MAGFFDALKSASKDIICQYLNQQSNLEDAFATLVGGGYDPSGLPGTAQWWLNMYCPNQPVPPPRDGSYQGGQCECVNYQMFIDYSYKVHTNGVPGPLQNTSRGAGGGFYGKLGGTRLEQINGFYDWQVYTGLDCASVPDAWRSVTTQQIKPSATTYVEIVNWSMRCSRLDGLPDNCGNRVMDPLPPPAPNSNVFDKPVTYDGPGGTGIQITPKFTIGRPFISPGLGVTIPVSVTINAKASFVFNITPTAEFNFVFPGGNSDGPSSPSECCEVDGPGGTKPTNNPPPSSIDPSNPSTPSKANDSIVGVVVTTTANQSKRPSIIPQDVNPDIYCPNLGFVSFLCRFQSKGPAAWTEDIPIKNLRQIVACPWPWGAIDVKGTPVEGNTMILTPIKRAVPVITPNP